MSDGALPDIGKIERLFPVFIEHIYDVIVSFYYETCMFTNK